MKQAITVIVMTLLFFMTSGCAGKDLVPAGIDHVEPVFSEPQSVKQEPYEFVVITKDNANRILGSLGPDTVYFALTPEGYRALNMNQAELRRYILQQKSVIGAYKSYHKK